MSVFCFVPPICMFQMEPDEDDFVFALCAGETPPPPAFAAGAVVTVRFFAYPI